MDCVNFDGPVVPQGLQTVDVVSIWSFLVYACPLTNSGPEMVLSEVDV